MGLLVSCPHWKRRNPVSAGVDGSEDLLFRVDISLTAVQEGEHKAQYNLVQR